MRAPTPSLRPLSRTSLALALASTLAGCAPWPEWPTAECSDDGCTETDATTDGGSSGSLTSTVTGVTSTTTGAGTTGTTEDATSTTTTTGEPASPPEIADHQLSPNPITLPGALDVTIWADHAEGVRMGLSDGSVTELTSTEPGVYKGEIFAYTSLCNGDYHATFTPWRAELEGDALEVPYTLDLPAAGTQDLWDLDYASGSGQVSAMGVLHDGNIVELVTLVANDTSGCYLRQRDVEGTWGPDDVVALLPDHCKTIDLEVDDNSGAIYLLLAGETNAGWMWWLAKMPHFGAPLKVIAYGDKDEVANALALSPYDGTLAVVGSMPTPDPGDHTDAMVRVIRPDLSSFTVKRDLAQEGVYHKFDEAAGGVDFLDADRIVVVGEVFGKHDYWDMTKRNRRFDAIIDLKTSVGDLRVAPASLATQSVARDVDVDDQGRAWIVGYVCNDVCEPEGQLWMLGPEGEPGPTVSLGLHSLEVLAPNQVRWNGPTGYIVVTSGGLLGSEPAFVVRAYAPLLAEPIWTFSREDAGLLHLAHALAIGPYGQVYAGGFGANGYPLFVALFG